MQRQSRSRWLMGTLLSGIALIFALSAFTSIVEWRLLDLQKSRTTQSELFHVLEEDVMSFDPNSESVGIVSFVPAGKTKFINQTNHMLFSSWKFACRSVLRNTRGRTDLLLFAHRDVIDQLPSECSRLHPANMTHLDKMTDHCYIIEHTPSPDDYWFRYSFMFSLTFLADPKYQLMLTGYDRLLRTDTDVVITPAFLTFKPSKFVVGRGGYMIENFTKTKIQELATDLKLTHQGVFNVGSTWFGHSMLVLLMANKMMDVAKFILESPKYNVDMGWPTWHIGVTSMYAGEIVVNHFIPKDNVWINSESIDINCNGRERTAQVYHSHCWPGDQYPGYFNKWAYERGEYSTEKFPRKKLNLSYINDYFMAMVLYGE
ncbi:hypothetical protein LEN26_009755 [Aphanomyces euteiches]|nr:hypothetical protein AeMF1_006925 [Aphanomyces euteiches]KAH9124278.1 hypothetical protein LEN26_009755 [Aphanomyces euteiches]KAH9183032.1 hypothetical protein AeNC1_014993 [Aphanomyces euteiches]